MSFRGAGPSNGGLQALGKRDRDDKDDEDGEKRDKTGFFIPKPLFPNRSDIPALPVVDVHNFNMIGTVIKLKQSIPYSIYNLGRESIAQKDGIERYSNRFGDKNKNTNELNLAGLKNGYFPYELVVFKKKLKKRAKNTGGKTLEELQRLEKEGGEGEGEGDENAEEEEEEEEVEGDYGEEMDNDDDSDGGGDSDDGGGEANF